LGAIEFHAMGAFYGVWIALMARNSTPISKTRYAIYDIKNNRLYSWIFFPTYKDAEKFWNEEFKDFRSYNRPKWWHPRDWRERKKTLENQITIIRVRWHVSRYDAIRYNLIEKKGED